MTSISKLFVCGALALASSVALASNETYKVMVQLNQAGKDLAPFAAVIQAGEEARYAETWTIDVTNEILTDATGKSKETVQPVTLGFDFRAKLLANAADDIVVEYSFVDSRVQDMHTLPVGDAVMKMPQIKTLSTGSTVAVEEGEPFVVFGGSVSNDSIVTMTVEKL